MTSEPDVSDQPHPAESLEYVVPCVDLDAMSAFFLDRLAARLETISPADDPAEIVVVAGGARIRLRRAEVGRPGHLLVRTRRLAAGSDPERLVAPDGTVVEFVAASTEVVVPDSRPSWSIVRAEPDDTFGTGRAGMSYRDLLPERWGGRFIASHIRIADGGDVADYVHFHRIRFQMIFVAAGWVDVVYEDQGPPFRMHRGDCVVQPPEIRHRVLRSSPGLEVIEIGCPARHDTVAEHEITLPTADVRPGRDFGGQRFVRHIASDAGHLPSIVPGLASRDTGIASATDGLAGARVLSATGPQLWAALPLTHHGEFAMMVVLSGAASFDRPSQPSMRLAARDAAAVPAGGSWSWAGWTDDFEVLEVTLPAGGVVAAT